MSTSTKEETPSSVATEDVTGHVKSYFRLIPDSDDGEHYICHLGIGLKAEGAKDPSRLIYLSWEGTDPYGFYEGEAPPDRPALAVPHASLSDYTLFEDFLAAVRARRTLIPAQACELLAELGYVDATEIFVTAVAPRYPGCDHTRFRLRVDAEGLFTDCQLYDPETEAETWEPLLPTPKLTRADGDPAHTLTVAYLKPEFGGSYFGVIVRDAAGAFVEVRRLDNTAVDEFNDPRDWYECLSVPRSVYYAVLHGFAEGNARVEPATNPLKQRSEAGKLCE